MTLHLGLDLGGTNIKAAAISQEDGKSDVAETMIFDTQAPRGPETVVENLIESGMKIIGNETFATVGLGVPGHFNRKTGEVVMFPNLPGPWSGFPVREAIEEGLGLPTWMVNDARAFTLAEGLIGAGTGFHTVACIILGTGIGGGIMIGERLHRGAFGVAGEIGHQTVLPDGPMCGCGNRGCVEALTKAQVIAEMGGKETAGEVFAAARAGDRLCQETIFNVAEYLGIALANVVTVLGPDRIVVGGGIAEAGDLLLDPIKQAVNKRVTLVPAEKIEIVPAVFGRYAGAVGAALAGIFKP